MLRVDIRDLQRGPVRTDGELPPDDPAFEGLGLELVGPVKVRGQLQTTGEGEYLWRGDLHGAVRGECRRCLTEVREELALAAHAHLLLCREDCAGLCPRCGADLNAGPCACHTPAEPA
jgi:uncharacterized metal-binding protein YceD (DUF177 family)